MINYLLWIRSSCWQTADMCDASGLGVRKVEIKEREGEGVEKRQSVKETVKERDRVCKRDRKSDRQHESVKETERDRQKETEIDREVVVEEGAVKEKKREREWKRGQ